MSKLTLWGHPRSINVQKVLWALDELGLAYERIDAGGHFGRNKEPDYLALNPTGLIPTLARRRISPQARSSARAPTSSRSGTTARSGSTCVRCSYSWCARRKTSAIRD